jgi:hypothetical protein
LDLRKSETVKRDPVLEIQLDPNGGPFDVRFGFADFCIANEIAAIPQVADQPTHAHQQHEQECQKDGNPRSPMREFASK